MPSPRVLLARHLERRTFQRVRRAMAALGRPIDHLADEQIAAAAAAYVRYVDDESIGVEEAAEGVRAVLEALERVTRENDDTKES